MFVVKKINVSKNYVIATEEDANYDDNKWAFDLEEFVNNTKKVNLEDEIF